MSKLSLESFDRLSDKEGSSDYDFCSNVASTDSLNTCIGDDSNVFYSSAANDNAAAAVEQEADGGDVRTANEELKNVVTEDDTDLGKPNELFFEAVCELKASGENSHTESTLQGAVKAPTGTDTEVTNKSPSSETDAELGRVAVCLVERAFIPKEGHVDTVSVPNEIDAHLKELSVERYAKVYKSETVEEKSVEESVRVKARLKEAVKASALAKAKLEEAVKASAEAHSGESFVVADAELEKAKKQFAKADAKLKDINKRAAGAGCRLERAGLVETASVSALIDADFKKVSVEGCAKVCEGAVEEEEAVKAFALAKAKLEEAVKASAEAHSGESFVVADAELEKAKKQFAKADAELEEAKKATAKLEDNPAEAGCGLEKAGLVDTVSVPTEAEDELEIGTAETKEKAKLEDTNKEISATDV